MSLNDYKASIKNIVESTNNEALLKHWQQQLEWDVQHQDETVLSKEEWNLVQEGLTDYENGAVLSLEEFIAKRRVLSHTTLSLLIRRMLMNYLFSNTFQKSLLAQVCSRALQCSVRVLCCKVLLSKNSNGYS